MSVQTLYTAATGMEALETKLEVIANNMANINTTGFKKDRANFEDLIYRINRLPGSTDADGISPPPASKSAWEPGSPAPKPITPKVPCKRPAIRWTLPSRAVGFSK